MQPQRYTRPAPLLVLAALIAGCGDSDKPNASQARDRMHQDINAQMDRIAADLAAEQQAPAEAAPQPTDQPETPPPPQDQPDASDPAEAPPPTQPPAPDHDG